MDFCLVKLANRYVDAIISNSVAVKELTSKKEGYDFNKIKVIYNGINVNEFCRKNMDSKKLRKTLGIPPHAKIVGIVAGLKPMKRHATFIKAAHSIIEQRDDVHFVIVGDGPMKTQLDQLTSSLALRQHVHFLGFQKNVFPFLAIFDVGINCSANEGLSNAIMEYMAYEVPCIVARAGGNTELVDNSVNGYTFELDNVQELTECILSLLDDEKTKEEFALRSKKKIMKELTLNKMITAYDSYFEEILKTL
jgi:glycosyltransferase involved in cell wall biosynthesis